MKNILNTVQKYKVLERGEHVSPDDVLNKVSQEAIELLAAINSGDENEIFSETGDVLVNILSIASELGCNLEDVLMSQKGERVDIIALTGKWNEAVQSMRGRYTRKEGNLQELESLTKDFVSTLLNYTNPKSSLGEVLKNNLDKLKDRKSMYKPDINPKDYIAEYPDFPKPGINFKDISPILANPDALRYVCHEMAESCRGADKIVALDARGFIFAPMIAQILGKPWIMARKPGKLPGETVSVSYDLEYGSNTIEIQKDAIQAGDKLAIVDDLLATGGTAMAAIQLIEKLGGKVHNCAFVIALDEEFLLGKQERKQLQEYPYSTVVSYD